MKLLCLGLVIFIIGIILSIWFNLGGIITGIGTIWFVIALCRESYLDNNKINSNAIKPK